MPDWLQLAQNAYSASTTWFDASVRRDLERDYRQFDGQHPPGSKYEDNSGRSKLFHPKTRAAIRQNNATAAEAFFSTVDVVDISAFNDGDEMQRAGAALMKHLLQHRLTWSVPWYLILNGAYQDAQKAGVVIGHYGWDYRPAKKVDRPLIRLIPPENFRIDPGAWWDDPIESSPYLIWLQSMYVKDVRERMQSGEWLFAGDEVIQSAVVPYDSLRQARERGRADSQRQNTAITDYTLVWVHEYVVEWEGADYSFFTLGQNHVLSEPVPLSEVYPHGQRPFVMGCVEIESHKLYPSGVPRLTRDVQAEINDNTNLRQDNIALALTPKWLVVRDKQVDMLSLQRRSPGGITQVTNLDDVKALTYPDMTASSFHEQDRLNTSFDDLAGVFSQSSVMNNRRLNETVGGMNILTQNSNQVGGYQLRTFVETWVKPMLRGVMSCIRHYETDEELIAIAAQRADLAGKFGLETVPDDLLLQNLTLTVNVGMGATSPADKLNRLTTGLGALKNLLIDGVLERYGLKVEEVIKEMLGCLGYADGGRFFDYSEDPRLIAARHRIQELQDALDKKVPPEMLAKQLERLDAEIKQITMDTVKTGVTAAFEAMQAGQVLANVPQVAAPADSIMAAMGYQPPNPPGVMPQILPPAPTLPPDAVQPVPHDTDPLTPVPPSSVDSPGTGAARGIETMREDSL